MLLTPAEMTKEGKECFEYLEIQPIYVQNFVTDCIIETRNVIEACDKFDAEVMDWLQEYRPDYVEQYKKEWRD